MAPSMRNITHAMAVVPTAQKEKGKTIEAPEPTDLDPFYLMSTYLTLEILTQTQHCHVGRMQLNWTPA